MRSGLFLLVSISSAAKRTTSHGARGAMTNATRDSALAEIEDKRGRGTAVPLSP
jgi:hypothetical protein